jgi:hypothetical protein
MTDGHPEEQGDAAGTDTPAVAPAVADTERKAERESDQPSAEAPWPPWDLDSGWFGGWFW